MLERPNITNEEIAACLQEAYGLEVARVAFLPLGADVNTAVFSVTTPSETDYFLKLRRGEFVETAVYDHYQMQPGMTFTDPAITW